ncbi:MAG: hypothetical protein Q8K50_05050 [Hydrogenophaga sp.]|nr:hypothetical protein [Hydrogenophaga sp.]
MTALYPLEMPENTEFFDHEVIHLMGESAADLIEPPGRTLAVLLRLAGTSPLHRRA